MARERNLELIVSLTGQGYETYGFTLNKGDYCVIARTETLQQTNRFVILASYSNCKQCKIVINDVNCVVLIES